MEFAVPPEFNLTPGGPPLWVSLAEKGYYGFKPTVCALCNSRTHDILQCPERKYFPDYVQEYIYLRNNSKWNWNNPHSEFYTQSLKEHLGQYFEQLNVPQELSVEDKLSKLLESTELYIEITNEGFQIQAVNRGRSYDDQEVGAGTEEQSATQSCPREETPPADRETISPQSFPPQVYVPLEPFPAGLCRHWIYIVAGVPFHCQCSTSRSSTFAPLSVSDLICLHIVFHFPRVWPMAPHPRKGSRSA